MENLIKWLENKVYSRQEYWSGVPLPSPIYLYIHINTLNYQSVLSPFPNSRIIESILSSLTHFSSMSPALGYTGGLLATRNVCNFKSHAHKASKCLRSEGKNEWLTAAVKLRYHSFARLLGSVLAASSWVFSPLLFTKKRDLAKFCEYVNTGLEITQTSRLCCEVCREARVMSASIRTSNRTSIGLHSCVTISQNGDISFFEWPSSMLVETMLYVKW